MENIANLSPELAAEVDDTVGIVQLICGEQNHRTFWAYVSMYPSKYQDYMAKVAAHETVNVTEYGIVIDTGWGTLPPQDVQDRMKTEFGADNNFETELNKIVQDAYNQEIKNTGQTYS